MEHQIEADIIPFDLLAGTMPVQAEYGRKLIIGSQRYEAVIVPFCEQIPDWAAEELIRLGKAGCPVDVYKRQTQLYPWMDMRQDRPETAGLCQLKLRMGRILKKAGSPAVHHIYGRNIIFDRKRVRKQRFF